MSRSIEFTASFGDETKHVDLSYVDLSDYYHIYIDKFYYGLVVHRNGKWTVLLQKPEAMTMDDIQALEEIIEESVRADS